MVDSFSKIEIKDVEVVMTSTSFILLFGKICRSAFCRMALGSSKNPAAMSIRFFNPLFRITNADTHRRRDILKIGCKVT